MLIHILLLTLKFYSLILQKTEDVLNKDHNCKTCFRLKLYGDKNYVTKRVISKILKLDENNQYGYAMTELLPTSCIKKKPEPTWRTFNILLEKVDLDDPVGHLFVVDISFNYEKVMPRQRIYNEMYPSIIEKQKIIDVAERSVYQLIEQYRWRAEVLSRYKKSTCDTFPEEVSTAIFKAFVFLDQESRMESYKTVFALFI